MEEMIMAFNKNELILDKVRSMTTHDLSTGKMLFRLTSLEDPSLQTSAEGEEVVDAIGALITTLYRAKKATFSASNSLISLDLAAAQFGSKKQVVSADKKAVPSVYEVVDKIIVPTYEIINVAENVTEVSLKKAPVGEVKYIYALAGNEIATRYVAGSAASATEFVIDEAGKITVPTGLIGKIYVEYSFESTAANRIINKTSDFPEACSLKIYAYFRDKCNENLIYSGVIVSPKAKLNPESVELALTSTGKHPFEFVINRDYCAEEGQDELFEIILAE
jgi:hypothetical protein